MQDGLEEKIDRLTIIMSKLTAKDDGTNKQFKPQIYASKRRDRPDSFMTNARQNNKGGYRVNYSNENYERGRSRSRERQYQGNIRRNNRSGSSRSRSGSRVSTNRDRIRCYECNEYDHFAEDCLTTKVEKETDRIQQMFNLDEGQTSLKT